jgi:hypothetical protein
VIGRTRGLSDTKRIKEVEKEKYKQSSMQEIRGRLKGCDNEKHKGIEGSTGRREMACNRTNNFDASRPF